MNDAWACAGAWKPCDLDGYHGGPLWPDSPPSQDCPDCHGTGRVYVLPDSVRVPCRQIHNLRTERSIRTATCAEVACLGWTPAESLETWLKNPLAGWLLFVGSDSTAHVLLRGGLLVWAESEQGEPLEALLSALRQALVAQGATLGQVPA